MLDAGRRYSNIASTAAGTSAFVLSSMLAGISACLMYVGVGGVLLPAAESLPVVAL